MESMMTPSLRSGNQFTGKLDDDFTLDVYLNVDRDLYIADLVFTSSMGEYHIMEIPRDELLRLARFIETTALQEMQPAQK